MLHDSLCCEHAHKGTVTSCQAQLLQGIHMAMVSLTSTGKAACESVLLQGDAFTFGSAESIPRSAMRRRSVVPTGKGQLANPGSLRAPSDTGKQPLSDTGNHDIA